MLQIETMAMEIQWKNQLFLPHGDALAEEDARNGDVLVEDGSIDFGDPSIS